MLSVSSTCQLKDICFNQSETFPNYDDHLLWFGKKCSLPAIIKIA